jgi:methylated-DNA-protein-cysteine methyltransferase-like protein
MELMEDFYRRVYAVVSEIPIGKVSSYGAIAASLGARSSARLVGHALAAAAHDMSIPCHRVVNRNGELTGRMHFATPSLMRELLESEGVTFDGDAVVMEKHFWNPGTE